MGAECTLAISSLVLAPLGRWRIRTSVGRRRESYGYIDGSLGGTIVTEYHAQVIERQLTSGFGTAVVVEQ